MYLAIELAYADRIEFKSVESPKLFYKTGSSASLWTAEEVMQDKKGRMVDQSILESVLSFYTHHLQGMYACTLDGDDVIIIFEAKLLNG